jgi:hypothetical protein
MCPSPPSPTTPTFFPLATSQCRIGEYVVIPAHSSGAAPAGSRFGGIRTTNRSSTTMLSEYPPYVTGAVWWRSGEPYVSTWPGQNCSSPAWQLGQVWSESTMQPTPTRSPALCLLAAEPTLVTRPTISCPGTAG